MDTHAVRTKGGKERRVRKVGRGRRGEREGRVRKEGG